jgi:PERQ amino acid-rich with GYF domain-containing protein
MPAPVAQRRQNVADTLTASSPSPAHTPSAETPSASIAPWAKETAEVPKGPSLKEIQEAEAKRAAQKEEIAAAARRAQLEKEILAQQQAAAAQNPGLPSTSTWASGATAPPSSNPAWAKPAPAARPVASSKKTLAQIQKEEEARKTRVTQTAATAVATASGTGKRYADLASKSAPAQPAGNGAWTTVGASGKAKGLVPPSAPARTVSSTVAVPAPARPKVANRSATIGNQAAPRGDAMEELKKWALKELRGQLNQDIIGSSSVADHRTLTVPAESFVDNLLHLGHDPDVLTEAVHSVSTTIDSRHFAGEFIRLHKQAEKGIAPPEASGAVPSATGGAAATNGGAAAGDGWSEVAKKGGSGQGDASNGSFRVVQGKGRNRRR